MLLLVLLALGAVYLLVKPATAHSHSDEPPLDRHVIRKVTLCVVLLLIYAAVFESLGFIPASVVFGIAMARLYDGTWTASVIAGVLMGVGMYLLFDKALDVPLPLGILSSLEI
jgi:putative tricarboxylic transport membrane protein